MPKGLNKYHSYQCRDKATKRRTKEKKKLDPKHQIKALDVTASLYYRQRTPYCEAKGLDHLECKGSLQWCHVFSRRYKSIRYEPYNNLVMCSAHHVYYTHRPEEWAVFMIEHFSKRWELARDNRNNYCKVDQTFIEKWRAYFKG